MKWIELFPLKNHETNQIMIIAIANWKQIHDITTISKYRLKWYMFGHIFIR